MLYLTSFGFGVVALHAAYVNDFPLVAITLTQALCSVLHHAFYTDTSAFFGGTVNGVVDKVTARVLTLFMAYRTAQQQLNYLTAIVWFAIAYTPFCYYTHLAWTKSPYPSDRITRPMLWHASLHIVACIGIHASILSRMHITNMHHIYECIRLLDANHVDVRHSK